MKTKVNSVNHKKKLTKKQEAINWRRNRVMQYHMMGLSETEIAKQLQISQPTISNDIAFIRSESAEQIHTLIEKELPLQFRKCRNALQLIQKVACQIAMNPKPENARIDSLRMTALQLFGDAQEKEFTLVADSNATAEALRFVNGNNLNQVLKKLEEKNNNDIPVSTEGSTKED